MCPINLHTNADGATGTKMDYEQEWVFPGCEWDVEDIKLSTSVVDVYLRQLLNCTLCVTLNATVCEHARM